MLDYLRSLYRHQVWADEELLRAVSALAPAQHDAELLRYLSHMAMAQRLYLARFTRSVPEPVRASEPGTWELVAHAMREVHGEELAFVEALTEAELEEVFELPRLEARFTLLEGMTQAVLHSQNHRGQCLRRLRELGGAPPTLDYILWAREHRPRPAA